MAMCYYCTRPGVVKRWVTVSRGRSGRIYFGKNGIRGMSSGRGATTAPRLLCATCAASHDRSENVVGIIAVAAVAAVIGFGLWANRNPPDYADHGKHITTVEGKVR